MSISSYDTIESDAIEFASAMEQIQSDSTSKVSCVEEFKCVSKNLYKIPHKVRPSRHNELFKLKSTSDSYVRLAEYELR